MSTDEYLDATAEFNQATTELDELADRVKKLSSALAFNRQRIVFDGEDARLAVRVGNVTSPAHVIDVSKWPTGEHIKQAVDRWNAAKQKVQAAWEKVPEHRRPALSPPPR